MQKDKRICGLLYFMEQENAGLIVSSKARKKIEPCLINNKIISKINFKDNHLTNENISNVLASTDADHLFFLVENRKHSSCLKRLFKKNDLEYLSSFIVMPSFENPRWILPCDKHIIKESRNIIKPSKIKSILAFKLFLFLNLIGYPQLLFSAQLISVRRQNCQDLMKGKLKSFLIKKLGAQDLEIILYTGSPGVFQKFTAQVVDGKGETVAYAKIGQGALAKETISDEIKTLTYLDNIDFKTLKHPKLILNEYLDNTSDLIMLQTPSPVNYKKFRKRLSDVHIAVLEELFLKTKKNVQGNIFLTSLENEFLTLKDKMMPDREGYFSLFKTLFQTLRKAIDKKEVTLGFSHGDFAPWNMFVGEKGLFVFDWEISRHRVPMWDFYNFIFHSEVLVFSRKHKDILNLLFDHDSIYADLILKYQKSFDSSMYFNEKIFLVITLYQIMIYYIDYAILQRKSSFSEKSTVNDLLQTASLMMQEVLMEI